MSPCAESHEKAVSSNVNVPVLRTNSSSADLLWLCYCYVRLHFIVFDSAALKAMLKVAVPSNTSDSNSSSSSATSKPGDFDADGVNVISGGRVRKKKRRWSVCAAKVKAGALKVGSLVTSDSSSESSEEGYNGSSSGSSQSRRDGSRSKGGSSQSERDSHSGTDSGFGEDRDRRHRRHHDRPHPTKVQQ